MNIKMIISILTVCVVIIIGIVVSHRMQQNNASMMIGIIQTASHRALDSVRDGFAARIKEVCGDDVGFIVQNAEGATNMANAIAQSMHANEKVKLICTIGTLASQVMVHVESEKPIVFAAVTDPQAVGLTNRKNVSGVSDAVDIEQEVQAIIDLTPQVKKVGILFNPAEINSVSAVRAMQKELEKHNIQFKTFGINTESEVPLVATNAVEQVDALLLPPDNIVASTILLITSAARKAKKPVFAGDTTLLKQGVFACAG